MQTLQKISSIVRTLSTMRVLRSHDAWSRAELKVHQDRSLTALRQFAYEQSPFYRELHKGLQEAPLEDLPIVTKAMMMDHFEDFVTDRMIRLSDVRTHVEAGSVGRFRKKYDVVTTSGSTGNPGIFLFDPREWATLIASFGRASEWAGKKITLAQRSRMAVVSSTNDRNLSARVGKAADTPFIPTLRFDATEPMADIVKRLNEWNPEALVAYASMAYLLAHEQKAGHLRIHPKKIFTSSEVLTAHMRETIENAWGNVVFNEYASTETATIAAEDEGHHGMHVFEDLLIVENVDEFNKPVPDGEFGGKLLVTTLFSRTQPLIRYEISDSVRFAKVQPVCRLPYRVIDAIEGRREDVLTIHGVQIHPNVFHDVMDAVPNKGWQIVQEKDGLRILLVQPQADGTSLQKRLTDILQEKGAAVSSIRIESVDVIPKAKSGKTPLIKAFGG